MKPLFTDQARYNETGNALHNDVGEQLRPIFEAYVKLGYSPRDIAHIMHWAVSDLELTAVLDAPV